MTQDMISQIEAQHRTLTGLLDAVDTATDTDHAFHLLRQVAGLLVRHAPVEEVPAHERVTADDPDLDERWVRAMVLRSREQRRLNHLIVEVMTRDAGDPGTRRELSRVTKQVRMHIATEAEVLLPVLRDRRGPVVTLPPESEVAAVGVRPGVDG